MKSYIFFILTCILIAIPFPGATQEEKKDSIWLTHNNRSVIEPFDSIDYVDSILPIWKNDYSSFDFLEKPFDTSLFYVYETRYPFGKGMYYSFEDGSDYYLRGDVHFFVSKDTKKIHGIYADWTLIEMYDSLVNTSEYMCELISRVSDVPLPGLKSIYKCEDYWTYESDNDGFYQKVVLEAPEPKEGDILEPIYYVSYFAFFK